MKSREHTRSKQIKAEVVEMTCEKCSRGVFRYDDSREVLSPYQTKQYPHKCSRCGYEVYISIQYPIIKFGNETWVLAKNTFNNQPR